jgi:hypothetical protein
MLQLWIIPSHNINSALTFTYTYDAAAGAGVDIFIVGKFNVEFSDKIATNFRFRHWWEPSSLLVR